MNNKIDLDDVLYDLENAQNLLLVFSEFMDECPTDTANMTAIDEALSAVTFARRFPMFYSLLSSTLNLLDKNIKRVEKAVGV